jgi:hypothetical protein
MPPGSRVLEGVQRRLRVCLDRLNCVKMAAFQIYLQSVKQKKCRVGGVILFVVKNSLLKKRNCEVVRFLDATASSFVATVRGEIFAYFHEVATKRHNSVRK